MITNKIYTFDKMHGAGNDYIYIDATKEEVLNPKELAIKISDRHFGVGADGLVLIMKSDVADFRMRMFNADGSEAEMCGNASRCVGKYVYEKGLTSQTECTLETLAGIKILTLFVSDSNIVEKVSVEMGIPEISSSIIIDGKSYACVSMGNPHAVTFVESVADFDVEGVGMRVENDAYFPYRTNVEFLEEISPSRLKMRVWERGSGETLACGTGACASLVVAHLQGKAERKATIELLGGEVEVEWKSNKKIILTGSATFVFSGQYAI